MPFAIALLASFLGGVFGAAFAVTWHRAFTFASGGAASTTPLVLAAYLLGIAEGAWLARWLCERYMRPKLLRALGILTIAAGVFGFLVIPALVRVVFIAVWGWGLPFVALTAAAIGAIAPIVSHLAIAPDDRAGSRVSYVIAASLVGSMLGWVLAAIVFLDVAGIDAIARFLGLTGLVIGTVIAINAVRGRERIVWAAGIAALAFGLGLSEHRLYFKLYERLLFKEHYFGDTFTRVVENRQGVVVVTPQHHVIADGIYEGDARVDLDDQGNRLARALGIAALHPAPRRVLMLGLGSGAWTQVIAGLPSIEDITVVDANPGYRQLLSSSRDVAPLLNNSHVHFVDADPRRWLALHGDDRFDVVIANEATSWRAHSATVFSTEFMRLVRDHLAAGGLFYFNTTGALDAYRTAFDVFPYGLRFANVAAVSLSPVNFDLTRWQRALSAYRLNRAAPFATTSPVGVQRLAAFLAMAEDRKGWYGSPMLESRAAMRARLHDATPITDDNMGGEWRTVYPVVYVP